MGRPKAITKKVWEVLEEAFLLGLSDAEACLKAGITKPTLYKYLEENPEKEERRDVLKENIKMHAKINIANGIKTGNIELSKYYLERTDKEFSKKMKVENENTNTQKIIFVDDISDDEEELTDFTKGMNDNDVWRIKT